MTTSPCLFCAAPGPGDPFVGREMMFGRRDAFGYTACAACRSVQIDQVPENLGDYYPPNYYSMSTVRGNPAVEMAKQQLRRARFQAAWRSPAPVRKLLARVWGEPQYVPWLKAVGADLGSSILDVGCGDGDLLRRLHHVGFRHLAGVDPFLKADTVTAEGIPLWKRTIGETTWRFDLIVFSHSLEHVPDPAADLAAAAACLAPGGHLVILLPIADSYAHRTYGTDWVQLDAPRHLGIPSVRGMEALAKRTGFTVAHTLFVSTAFQFVGSEQYQLGIPLLGERSYAVDPSQSPFSKRDVARFEQQADALNASGDGDTACFVLRR